MRFLNNVKTVFLLGSLMGLCMLVGHLINPGGGGMLIGLVLGGMGSVVSFFFSDKIAIAAMGGRQIQRQDLPWLFDMIERLAHRAGLPMPKVYVCPGAAPNAFATGRDYKHSAVAITQGMLQNFPEHEIEGVMAHELAHIKHRDMLISTIAAVMAGMLSYAGYMLMFMGGGNNRENQSPLAAVGAIAMVILAPIAAMIIQMAISRQREYAADSYGGELCGDPKKLASALARLANANARIPTDTNPAFHSLYIAQPLSGRGMMSLFSTHPPIEQRIALLREQALRTR
ncbi:MAG: M48 family metalloprotease [Phycisphaerae bacterium]